MKLLNLTTILATALATPSAVSAFTTSVPQQKPTFFGRVSAATSTSSSQTQLYLGKTIAVIGASGLTSSECVYQALQNGDKVIGLTRNPSNLLIPKGSGGSKAGEALVNDNLTMIAGDVTKLSDVQKVFEASSEKIDGVIIGLGGKTSDVGESMLTDGTKNVIECMKEKDIQRLSVITSIGAGDSENQAPFFFKILMMTAMKKIFVDKNNQEDAVIKSGLEYCIVRPGGLTVEPPTGIVNVIDGEAGSISRADVAEFCLDSILMEDFPYIGKAPCISSVGGTGWTKDRSAKARSGEEA